MSTDIMSSDLKYLAFTATAFWAMTFFWLRLAHAVVYLLGIPYLRTLIFTLGYVAVICSGNWSSSCSRIQRTCVWRATREHLRRKSVPKTQNADQGRTFHE